MFADILKDLRAKSGLSQSQLAKEIGVSPGNVSDWELGKTKPGYIALSALSTFFRVSADYLLELERRSAEEKPGLETLLKNNELLCDGSPLTEVEADIIAMYRLLPESHCEELFDLIHFKYKRYVEMKKGSIYSTYSEGSNKQKDDPVSGIKPTLGIV